MYTLKTTQKLPISLEQCWEFFSSPANLKILTPAHLRFEMESSPKMYPGQIISHKIYPIWNIPVNWVTEITHVEEGSYFIDEQRLGPFKLWHHEHRFQPLVEGVEVTDTVYYQMPFGVIGKALHALKVRKDLEAIFAYRDLKLKELFGTHPPF